MNAESFTAQSPMPVSADELYRWHMRPGAFERLTPGWAPIEIVERSASIETPGARVVLSIPVGPFRIRWIAEHDEQTPGREFRDVQVRGPFALWEHRHRFHPEGADESVLEDAIRFRLPAHALARFIAAPAVRRELARVFAFRHETTAKDLAAHKRYEAMGKIRCLVTGSTGLVGSELVPFLQTGGHDVVRLRRRASGNGALSWSPEEGRLEHEPLEGFDAVVHLAGESIASGRWNEAKKRRIRESRVAGTRLLSEALASLDDKPRVLLSASATGYYGDRGDEVLGRGAPPGTGFLADGCREWEEATEPARVAGIRVVNLRIGMVLSPKGGALHKMLPPFRIGAGGVIGSGEQYVSWISIDDLAGVILHALASEAVEGPVNAVSPAPVTNRELTRVLARVLRRPALVPVPAIAARLAMGDMADELLLASARVVPEILEATGYAFRRPTLEGALRHLLGR